MRAGPLSNPEIIETLNRYYVPVVSSNEETEDGGKASPAEKAERRRIYLDFFAKKLGIGDVHVYVIGPDKASIGGLDISRAMDSAKLLAFLRQAAARLQTRPGPPVVKPRARSVPEAFEADSMALHLVSRSSLGGSWHEFPAENWIVLSRSEWSQLLPAREVSPGASWEIPRAVAVKLAEWIYPQAEEKTQVNHSRVDVASFRMRAVRLENGLARARIEGVVRLKRTSYPRGPTDDYADSQLLGYMDFGRSQRRIQRLRLVTTKATYINDGFEAALVSVSRETLDAPGQ